MACLAILDPKGQAARIPLVREPTREGRGEHEGDLVIRGRDPDVGESNDGDSCRETDFEADQWKVWVVVGVECRDGERFPDLANRAELLADMLVGGENKRRRMAFCGKARRRGEKPGRFYFSVSGNVRMNQSMKCGR